MRNLKLRDEKAGAERDVLEQVSEEDGARTRTDRAELGSKSSDLFARDYSNSTEERQT